MPSNLWQKVNYTARISYLNNVFIWEYDISKCNINILFEAGVIDEETYKTLYSAERMARQKYVGMLCKDKSIYKILAAGIIEAKRKFFEANNIQDNEVLAVKNDAIFVMNREMQFTEFGLIRFVKKNIYTAFYKLTNLELYYYYNNISKEEWLHVKVIKDEYLTLHSGFLEILKDLFYTIQTNGATSGLWMLKDIFLLYTSLKLPVNCYRNFNSDSMYHLKYRTKNGAGFLRDYISDSELPDVDISYNAMILSEIQKIIANMYFNNA